MKNIIKVLVIISLMFLPTLLYAVVGDYLILQNINSYRFITQSKDPLTKKIVQIPGYTTRKAPGFLAGADHFDVDHDDITYETDYESDVADLGVEVQVTQHPGSDSDKWLLHEVEGNFRRNPEQDRFKGVIREINGKRIFTYSRGAHYNWISNNIVVDIRYTDLQKNKPEPLEVITAYLQKHPSTIPSLVMDSAHDVQWIKEEMDRRLWLCDKWFMQLQFKKAEEKDVYRESVKSISIFLDYREKYYGIKAADEKNILASYLNTNNGTGIKAKLTEYKNWWTVNKEKSISL